MGIIHWDKEDQICYGLEEDIESECRSRNYGDWAINYGFVLHALNTYNYYAGDEATEKFIKKMKRKYKIELTLEDGLL